MKEYAIYLPDILIESSVDIISIFNFKNIRIFTSAIYNNNIKVHDDDIFKILKLLKSKEIKGIIIYYAPNMSIKNINKIKLYCNKYNCKLYFFYYFVRVWHLILSSTNT